MEDGVVEVVDSSFNDSGKVTEADLSEGVSRTHAEDQVYHASFEKNLSLSETTPSLVTKNSLLPDMPLVAPAALPPGNVFVDERPQINSPSKSKHDVIHSYDLAATMEGTWQTNEENTTIAVVTDAAAAAAQEALDEPNVMGDSKPAPKYLTLERKAKLDELGFVWCFLTKRGDVMWDDMFQKVRQELTNLEFCRCAPMLRS